MIFTKMQGAGNDFIVLNNMELKIDPNKFPDMARRLCLRGTSIGANGLMVADFPEQGGDFQMRFYNADGTIAEMCGNGARCLARFAYEHSFAQEHMRIETVAGEVLAWRQDKRLYKIQLNNPTVLELIYPIEIAGVSMPCSYVELGCPGIPHAVVPFQGLADKNVSELRELGALLCSHPRFHKGANINFYDINDVGEVTETTYERGVEDFTLACGTGSAATALVLVLTGKTPDSMVKLNVPGGVLWVDVKHLDNIVTEIHLIGDTNIVAVGEITDEDGDF